jgi:NADH-quinone oxidoreductase subunit N
MALSDLVTILPLIVLVTWGTLLLLVDLWIPPHRKGITALLAAVGLVAALGAALAYSGQPATVFSGFVTVDGFAVFLDVIFLTSGIFAVALAYNYLRRMHIERGEYYSLLMFAIAGMVLMTYANDLIMVFLALEFLSIPLYILAGFSRQRAQSGEAALKYFLIGAFSSGVVLYGISLVYGATAATSLPAIVAAVTAGTANPALLLVGSALLLVGFSFKAGIVPFHMWAPDVYEGAPSSVTAFMTVGAKAAGFAAMMRVFITALPSLSASFTPVLWGLAALTMVVGNVVALAQNNVKRLLAYASIAQSGYMLMAFVPFGNGQVLKDSVAAMLFYLVAYSLTTLGAWAVVIAVECAEGEGLTLESYAGLGRRHPWLALAMTVFMLSFTGVPLTLGFWGKLYLFSTAVQGGFVGLALIGLITSIVSAYYYLRVVVMMFMRSGEPQVVSDPWVNATALVSAAAVLGLSFIPASLMAIAVKAVMKLL